MDQRDRALDQQETEQDWEEEDRQRDADEEASRRAYYKDEYGKYAEDPEEIEAFGQAPTDIQAFRLKEVKELDKQRRIMEGVKADTAYLGTTERGKIALEELGVLAEAGDVQKVAVATQVAAKNLKKLEAVNQIGMARLGKAQAWAERELSDPLGEGSVRPEYVMAMGEMQRALESYDNPNLEPLTQKRLDELTNAIEDAKIPESTMARVKEKFTEEAYNDFNAGLEEQLRRDAMRRAARPGNNAPVGGGYQAGDAALGPVLDDPMSNGAAPAPAPAEEPAPVDEGPPPELARAIKATPRAEGEGISWAKFGSNAEGFKADSASGAAQAASRGKENQKRAREALRDYMLPRIEAVGGLNSVAGQDMVRVELDRLGFGMEGMSKAIEYLVSEFIAARKGADE
jgi:hypothetical protein